MKLSTQILLGFFTAISIDLLDSYFNYSLTLKVKINMDFLNNSEAIIRNSSRLNKSIIDMQSAFRGYLLTDDEHFLLPYYSGLNTIPELIDREEQLIRPSSSQHMKLDSIVVLHNRWIDYASLLIKAKKNAITPTLIAQYQNLFDNQFRKQVGKSYNDQIANIFSSFTQYEYTVREKRRAILADSIKRTERSSLLFSVLLIIVGSGIAFYLVKKISLRISSMVKVAEDISLGNFSHINDNKNDELSSLSISLNTMSDKLNYNIHELEKKNDELNQFAYVVSHDLKAPVRGINNVLHWIEEDFNDEVPQKLKKYLGIIPERLKRMENLIDGLLQYARVGREKQLKEIVDVEVLINELAEVSVPMDCKLVLKNMPQLWTERLLLEQVFSNLINNAVKYIPGKGAKISISCMEHQHFFEFNVSDNGIGISTEYHEKIFEIFQTLREKHDRESTGIGLAIVKKIVEDKHCSIRVVSAAGKGASFIFTLPKK